MDANISTDDAALPPMYRRRSHQVARALTAPGAEASYGTTPPKTGRADRPPDDGAIWADDRLSAVEPLVKPRA